MDNSTTRLDLELEASRVALHLQVEHAVGYHVSDTAAVAKHERDHELASWGHSHEAR